MGLMEKIKEIEAEMARTQKNKVRETMVASLHSMMRARPWVSSTFFFSNISILSLSFYRQQTITLVRSRPNLPNYETNSLSNRPVEVVVAVEKDLMLHEMEMHGLP